MVWCSLQINQCKLSCWEVQEVQYHNSFLAILCQWHGQKQLFLLNRQRMSFRRSFTLGKVLTAALPLNDFLRSSSLKFREQTLVSHREILSFGCFSLIGEQEKKTGKKDTFSPVEDTLSMPNLESKISVHNKSTLENNPWSQDRSCNCIIIVVVIIVLY